MIKFLKILLTFLFFLQFSINAKSDESQPELIQLYHYKPMYFIMGEPFTKIQFSIEAQIVSTIPFYFAYSQLMIWDLFRESPYFRDLNYNPEIFYRIPIEFKNDKWLDIGIWEHESNGKGGAQEISWDRIYLRYHTRTDLGERARLFWNLKAWYPVIQNPNNKDLPRYRGTWSVDMTFTDFMGRYFDRADLILRLYPGGKSWSNPLVGAQEITFQAKLPYKSFLPMVVLQFFHGFGENQTDYKQDRLAIRLGIGF